MFNLPNEEELTQRNLDGPFFKYQFFGLRIVGIFYPTSQPKFHHVRGVITALSFLLFNIGQYIDLIMVWGNLNAMMVNLGTSVQFTTVVYRLQKFFANRSSMDFNQRNFPI